MTLGSTGQGQPAQSRSHTGTGSKVKKRAGCLVKGWSPYNFGVTLDTGSLRGTAFPAQLPGKRNNTASRAHVLVTCVQLHSSQSEWRGARATGKETLLWDTEPPSQGPLTKQGVGKGQFGMAWHSSPRAAKRKRRKLKPCVQCSQKPNGISHSPKDGEDGVGTKSWGGVDAPASWRAGGHRVLAEMGAAGSSHGCQHRGHGGKRPGVTMKSR